MKRKQRMKIILIARNVIMAIAAVIICTLFIVQARNSSLASTRSRKGLDNRTTVNMQMSSSQKTITLASRSSQHFEHAGQSTDDNGPAAAADPLHYGKEGEAYQDGAPLQENEIEQHPSDEGQADGGQQLLPAEQVPPDGPVNSAIDSRNNGAVRQPSGPGSSPGWQSRRELEQRLGQ